MSPPDRLRWRPPAIPRRQVLRAAVLGLAAPALVGGASSCTFGDPDPLLALAFTARMDGALIDTAARTFAQLAGQLRPVAAARREHAAALDTEIARLDANYTPPGTPPSTPPSASPGTPRADGGAQAALAGVLQALASSARQATDLVPSLPGHRAGLVGSIAACCSGYRAVLG